LRCHGQRTESFAYDFRPEWKWNNEEGKTAIDGKIKNLLIFEGANALNVINPSILKKKCPAAKLEGHKVEVFLVEDFTICVVEEKDLNYFATITELLEPWIAKAENCTIVSLQSLSEFKAENLQESCVVRAINSQLKDIPRLEAPNFITGVGAGVGTFRKLNNQPFSCYIVYIDLFDVFSIKLILNLLKRLNLSYDETVTLRPLHHKSDLYM
jgi:hypothetical protein